MISEAELIEIEGRAEAFLSDIRSDVLVAIGEALAEGIDYREAMDAFEQGAERVMLDVLRLIEEARTGGRVAA